MYVTRGKGYTDRAAGSLRGDAHPLELEVAIAHNGTLRMRRYFERASLLNPVTATLNESSTLHMAEVGTDVIIRD